MIALCAILILTSAPAAGSDLPPSPRLVRAGLPAGWTRDSLIALGFDVLPSSSETPCDLLAWPGDESRLAALGVVATVLDPNPGATAGRQVAALLANRPAVAPRPVWSAARADGRYRVEALPAVGYGSVAGYWSIAQIKVKLDELVASDSRDLVAGQVDTLGWSWQGRPIWGLEIGKRHDGAGPDPRPVVFMNALTHAREPMGMQAVLGFVDDLLAGYGTDPIDTYLLEHRRLYICPLVNPDGYALNERLWTSKYDYGYWRKNVRDNDADGVFDGGADSGAGFDGVDLNRNFTYLWGIAGSGSGVSPGDLDYRGPWAGSEPETRAQMEKFAALGARTALSFHSYGNVLLHPWGYTANGTWDSLRFQRWTDDMTRGTFVTGGPSHRVLYPVIGSFTDWAYGEHAAFAWTPEIGGPTDGFWPWPTRIVGLAQSTYPVSRYVMGIAGLHPRVERVQTAPDTWAPGTAAAMRVDARNLGLGGGDVRGTLRPLSPGIRVSSDTQAFGTMGPWEVAGPQLPEQAWFRVEADRFVTAGERVSFEILFSTAEGAVSRDTFTVTCGVPRIAFAEDFNALDDWILGPPWGTETDGTRRWFSDSPSGPVPPEADAVLTLRGGISAGAAERAWIRHRTRWMFQGPINGALIEGSRDRVNWAPLPSTATIPAPADPYSVLPAGAPAVLGSRSQWREDWTDLSGLLAPPPDSVWVRFRTRTVFGSVQDGLQLGDVAILVYDPPADVRDADGLALAPPMPNPARDHVTIGFANPSGAVPRVEVLDVQGRRVRDLPPGDPGARTRAREWDLRDEAGARVAPGLYFVRIATGGTSRARRLVVLR